MSIALTDTLFLTASYFSFSLAALHYIFTASFNSRLSASMQKVDCLRDDVCCTRENELGTRSRNIFFEDCFQVQSTFMENHYRMDIFYGTGS